MEKLTGFIGKYFSIIVICMLALLILRTCNNDIKVLSKKVEALSSELKGVQLELDSLEKTSVTITDLRIEGLRSEKRMIQSTDRKMLDVSRQSEIDKEIQSLSK